MISSTFLLSSSPSLLLSLIPPATTCSDRDDYMGISSTIILYYAQGVWIFLLVVAFWRYCWASIRSCEHRSNQLFYSYLSGTVVISCFNHACPAPVLIWHSSDQLLYLYLSCTAVNNSVTNNCSNQLFKPVPVRHSSELLSRPSSRWVQNHHRSGLNQRL